MENILNAFLNSEITKMITYINNVQIRIQKKLVKINGRTNCNHRYNCILDKIIFIYLLKQI